MVTDFATVRTIGVCKQADCQVLMLKKVKLTVIYQIQSQLMIKSEENINVATPRSTLKPTNTQEVSKKEKMPNKRNAIGSPSRAMGKKSRAASRTGGQRARMKKSPKEGGAVRKRTAKKTQGVGHVMAEGPVETTDFPSGNESEEDARAFPL
ncbi:unnamed protein product [Mytilus edulis]|uniref:Uncharacterized protein n=1 Tax=Mytilus edulis TaxID=6550 RepID=A0A8S3V2V7_MYTED|nr:unnamed protein product [Mytilus edulis]